MRKNIFLFQIKQKTKLCIEYNFSAIFSQLSFFIFNLNIMELNANAIDKDVFVIFYG